MTSQRFTKLSTRWRYTLAAGIAIVVTALRYSLVPWGGTIVPYNAWIVGVAVTTILVGFGPGLLCALLGVAGVEVFVLQSLPTLFEATTIARISTTSFAGVVIAFMIHATRVAATQSQNNAERIKTFAAATFEGIVESEAGRIVGCNAQFARLTGYTMKELKGMVISDLIVPEDRDRVQAIIRLNLDTFVELVMQHKDGSRSTVEAHGRLLSPVNHSRYTVFRDTTARKQAEDALRESESRFRSIFENSLDAIFLTIPDGRVLSANPAACSIFGMSEEEIIRVGRSGLIDPNDPKLAAALEERKKTGRVDKIELDFIRKNGQRFPAELDSVILPGEPQPSIVILRDITERKRVIEELQLTRTSIDAAAEMFAQFTPDGKVRYVNDATCRMLGYSRNELLQMTALDFSPGFTWEQYSEHWREIREKKSLSLEVTHRRKDGSEYPAEVLVNHVLFSGQEYIFAYGRNITERKQAEETFRQRAEEIERLLEAVPAAVWVARDPQCLNIIGNRKANEFYEAQPGENVSATTLPETRRFFTPDGRELTAEQLPMQKAAAGNQDLLDSELQVVLPSGRRIIMLGSAVPLRDQLGNARGCIGAFMDITDRKKTEEALRESEGQFRVLIQNLQSAVALVNERGEFTIVNQAFLRIFELNEDSSIKNVNDRDWSQWRVFDEHGTLLDIDNHPVRKAAMTCRPVRDQLIAVKAPTNPKMKWLLVSAEPVLDSHGQIYRLICTYHNITNQKHAEETIKTSLAEKEVLLKEIHHRVKNNLQVISSLISLQADALTDARILEELDDVRDRVRSMALVHEKLYQTSDLSKLNFAEYATSLAQAIWRSHSALARNVRLNLAVEPVSLSIETVIPCGLILNELLGNALKHAFPDNSGGEVEVGVKIDPATKVVCLRVRDNGVGLPAGLDWSQLKSLGLRLVKILASQVLGTVETTTDPGTEIKIIFPLKEDKQ